MHQNFERARQRKSASAFFARPQSINGSIVHNEVAMLVLIVEDDPVAAHELERDIRSEFSRCEVMAITSEEMFLSSLADLEMHPPDVALVDVMLPWTSAEDDDSEAAGGYRSDAFSGGIRVVERILASPALKTVPVIVRTTLAADVMPSGWPGHVVYSSKSSAVKGILRSVLSAVRRLPPARRKPVAKRIWNAINATPGFGGISLDLKKLFE